MGARQVIAPLRADRADRADRPPSPVPNF